MEIHETPLEHPDVQIQNNSLTLREMALLNNWSTYEVQDEDPLLELDKDDSPDDDTSRPYGELEPAFMGMKLLHRSEIILLMLSYLGLNLMFLILSVEIVPAQVVALVGHSHKSMILGGLVAVGAVINFISGPLIGMLSDRLVTPFGRRRPIMVIASILLTIGLLGMAFSVPQVNLNQVANNTNGDNTTCFVDLEWNRCKHHMGDDNITLIWQRYMEENHMKAGVLAPSIHLPSIVEETTSGHIGLFIPSYFLVTFSYVAILTPYNALVADRSHPDQRGLNSGVMGGMILCGNIGGAAMGLLINPIGLVWVYIMGTVIVLLCVAITVLFTPEPVSSCRTVANISCAEAIKGFWVPLRDNDFRWVFITRFLMQMGVTSVVGFLEFWLSDMIPLPNCWNPFRGLSLILLPLLVFAAISSVFTGILSDRLGVRKSLVITASIMMGCVSVVLSILRGEYAYYVSIGLAIIFGMAFGGYQAVDFALLMDVLPDPNEKSRDIAVWQQSLVLPQALAVPVGGLIIDLFERVNCRIGLGYIIMFNVTGLYFFISGFFVSRIQRST